MSSEVFENHESDIQELYESLNAKYRERLPKTSGEERKRLIREIDKVIEDGNFLLQEMEEEAKHAPPAFRTSMISKVRGYRRDLDQMARNVRRSNADFGAANFGYDPESDFERIDTSHRARLLAGSEALQRTSDSIARSHQISAETDQIGTEVIGDLGRQREALERTKDRLTDTDANLSTSRQILKTMARRIMTNKLILIVIIIIEIAILAGLIYWKFFSTPQTTTPHPTAHPTTQKPAG